MVAEIGNGMADLLAAHFNSGLVAAKLGGGERPVCGNPGTGALWRDLGFVAQRYVVKVLWYSRITFFVFPPAEYGERKLAQIFSCFLDLNIRILHLLSWMLSCKFNSCRSLSQCM